MNKNLNKIRLSIIVVIAEDGGIGKDNDLLFQIPGDLPRFKRITSEHTVIMGRNTFISLPKGALPNRTNIVISDNLDDAFENCLMASSIDNAIELCKKGEEIFIIGGGMIYKQFLPIAHKLYITRVHKKPDADTFFPEIDFEQWKLIYKESHLDINPPHTYLIYNRK